MSRKAKYALLIILIAVAAILVLEFSGIGKIISPPKPSASPSPLILSPETVRRTILSKTILLFPSVTAREGISFSRLPKNLSNFIREGAHNLKIEGVTYAGGAKGFYVQYAVSDITFDDLYNELRTISRRSDWTILTTMRTNLFAVREIETPTYQVRISQSLNSDKSITVTVEALAK